jgi:toxin ParE1/3/4
MVDIYLYIAHHDAESRADSVLDGIEERCRSLSVCPQRGHTVPELQRIHVDGYREIHWGPYRIIYGIASDEVFIHSVLDGRRDLQDILERRILR